MVPYDDTQAASFAVDCVAVYPAGVAVNPSRIGLACARMQRDVDTDSQTYASSRAKHLADLRAEVNPNPVPAPPVPEPGPVPPNGLDFHSQGKDFVNSAGTRIVLNGADQFCAYRRFLDGQDLTPLFDEAHTLGFNLWRVFLMGSVAQNTILQLTPSDAGYYEHVRPFADLLNIHGIILLATVFVDNEDIHAGLDHWQHMADLLRGSTTILSGGNEFSKNGFDPGMLIDPGMLWSRGSDVGDARPFQPTGSVMEFHPRRDLPASLLDSVASPVTIYGAYGYPQIPLLIDEPLGFAETDQPGKRSNDPLLAYRLARHYSTETACAVFHSDAGIRSQLMGPVTRTCAEAWQRGMKL